MKVRINPATLPAYRHTIYLSRAPERLASRAVMSKAPIVPLRIGVQDRARKAGAPVAATKGGSAVDHRARFSTLNARYEDFLFAPVCEEANGMRLTVLSALARTNVDPWEAATRLAAMPKAIAETTLLSMLDLVSGRSWKSPEAAAVAARLVRLLPQPGEAAAIAPAEAANVATGSAKILGLGKSYWWVWLGFWLAMSFIVPHHQPTTNAGATTSESGVPSQLKSNTPDPVGQSR